MAKLGGADGGQWGAVGVAASERRSGREPVVKTGSGWSEQVTGAHKDAHIALAMVLVVLSF